MSIGRRTLFLLVTLGVWITSLPKGRAENPESVALPAAVRNNSLRAECTGNGRDQLRVLLSNPSSAIRITIPAGLILKAQTGERIVVIRSADVDIPGKGDVETEIPVAALARSNGHQTQRFEITSESEAKLESLLKFITTLDDVPRATSQLVVLALLENVTFAQWQQFNAAQGQASGKPGDDVIRAIDALGLLRELEPRTEFALAKDNQLKLLALRNPVARTKAVQLFGIKLPDEPAVASGEAPNLRQLLHTQPGDNCPVCRMREKTARGAGDF